jgi:hypothetical protein
VWSEVEVGSNRFAARGGRLPGVLRAGGRELIYVERGSDHQLLLTMEIYDADGSKVALLRRNAWPPAHDPDRYTVTTNPASLTLTDQASGDLILRCEVRDADKLVLNHGRFFTPDGTEIELSPEGLTVRGNTFSRNQALDRPNGFVIDCESIGFG